MDAELRDPGRRRVLRAGGALAAAAVTASTRSAGAQEGGAAAFPWGVASFDPTADAVLLWTRVDPARGDPVPLTWVVAADEDLTEVVASGIVHAGRTGGHCVTVDATGLSPATTWWYRFTAPDGATSPLGRTRTVPTAAVERLRLGVASCSRYASGGFAAYRSLAAHEVDLVVHVGDYIYEDGRGGARAHVPAAELVTLDQYRARYAQHRLDPDLQALHARHPMVTIWDDHDVADNAWSGGAAGHDPIVHGPWIDRLRTAGQAHEEWLPGRTGRSEVDGRLRAWRSVPLGALAELVVMDTRTWGRDHPPRDPRDLADETLDAHRSMLGEDQMRFVSSRLEPAAGVHRPPWIVLVSPVVFHPMEVPVPVPSLAEEARRVGSLVDGDRAINPDQWDGYPTARGLLARAIGGRGGVVVVSGDLHSSWAWEGPANDGGRPTMVELVAPATSSEVMGRRLPGPLSALEGALTDLNAELSHVDLSNNGYMLVELGPEEVHAEWWYVDPDSVEPARFGAGRSAPRAVPMHLVEVHEPLPDPDRPGPPAETPPPSTDARPGRSDDDSPAGALVGGAAVVAAAAAAVLAVRRRRPEPPAPEP